jgi:phosphate transport system substrate-binding protein
MNSAFTNGLSIYERQTMRFKTFSKAAVIAVAAAVAITPSAFAVNLTGSGASSVSGFIEKCKTAYQTATNDVFTYNGSAGSSTGIANINAGTVDLAYSDSVNTTAPATVIHVPAAIWPVAISYNLNNSASKPLQLSVPTVAKIFSGQITMWNDKDIVADNSRVREIPVYETKAGKPVLDKDGAPKVKSYRKITIPFTLPNKPITVLYRSTGSGTTDNFTKALAAAAPTIWTKAGNTVFSTANPTDISKRAGSFQGFSSSATISAANAAQKYSITYVEASFVASNPGLKSAMIINGAGKTVAPDALGAGAMFAAASLNEATGIVTWDYKTTAAAAYPFTAPTYAMVKTNYGADKAAAVKRQVEYMAFDCIKTVTTEPMIAIDKASDLGKAILKLTAKIG